MALAGRQARILRPPGPFGHRVHRAPSWGVGRRRPERLNTLAELALRAQAALVASPLALNEIGSAAFELRRGKLDLHVPALQRSVLAVAVLFPVQRRFVVTPRRLIMRLGCFQMPLGHL